MWSWGPCLYSWHCLAWVAWNCFENHTFGLILDNYSRAASSSSQIALGHLEGLIAAFLCKCTFSSVFFKIDTGTNCVESNLRLKLDSCGVQAMKKISLVFSRNIDRLCCDRLSNNNNNKVFVDKNCICNGIEIHKIIIIFSGLQNVFTYLVFNEKDWRLLN